MYLIASMRYLVYATDELRLFTGRTIFGVYHYKEQLHVESMTLVFNHMPLYSNFPFSSNCKGSNYTRVELTCIQLQKPTSILAKIKRYGDQIY